MAGRIHPNHAVREHIFVLPYGENILCIQLL